MSGGTRTKGKVSFSSIAIIEWSIESNRGVYREKLSYYIIN